LVFPAVLRDPARDPEQALRRDGARRLDPHPRLPAVARYVESALGALSSALSPVLLGLRDRLRRSRLARRQAPGRQLRADRAHLHGLLLRLFLLILPVLGKVERTKPLPNSISESVLRD